MTEVKHATWVRKIGGCGWSRSSCPWGHPGAFLPCPLFSVFSSFAKVPKSPLVASAVSNLVKECRQHFRAWKSDSKSQSSTPSPEARMLGGVFWGRWREAGFFLVAKLPQNHPQPRGFFPLTCETRVQGAGPVASRGAASLNTL